MYRTCAIAVEVTQLLFCNAGRSVVREVTDSARYVLQTNVVGTQRDTQSGLLRSTGWRLVLLRVDQIGHAQLLLGSLVEQPALLHALLATLGTLLTTAPRPQRQR
jgi:hypothetical protein